MTPPTPWSDPTPADTSPPTAAPAILPPPDTPASPDDDPTGTAPPTPTLLLPPPEPAAADEHAPPGPPAPDHESRTPTPALLLPPPEPAAADDEHARPGPPAPDHESRTGGAGGKLPAEGEAEAVLAPAPAQHPRAGGKLRAEGEAEAVPTHRPAQPTAHRVRGLLLGLAAGDAAGWPAARHRAARMPDWTRRLTRELETFAEQNATTTLPVPIALNQPPEPLRLGPSDDAEWAAFTAEALLRAGDDTALGDLSRDRRVRAAIDLTWNAVAGEVAAAADRAPEVESAVLPLRARISVRAGLGNLATGLRPPATGHDNPHFFDDAACVRACVLAVAHPGDPARAADLAEFDARYTQDGDGVLGARAMAAAVSLALTGTPTGACVAAALTELPAGTEIGRNARHAVDLAHAAAGAFALVPLLEHQIVDHVYSYGVAAAETVPVALALTLAAGGRIAEAVPAAACLSRVADSAPALAGALTGALGGDACVPAAWRDTCRTLSGCALPRLTGTDLVELADLLEAAQPHPPGG
ncbi:ADP-ribosylglycohydrolase family protein [Streptomyces sp. SS1-1]|uniref:ADP-ribosylglycohydrolase family protein n=1 Tax=Streptomyces sp. SS1-1 TaxID=2651869 RepID=UPI0012504016|nr:ADP-ribosylglycohydrolase family protein [Streptomyces sp. SS1-1]KAB2972238.1 ADP-ribosylglycohydrolase family protein [Streptomyces sp. SS1-1]